MSWDAVGWAFRVRGVTSNQKIVLLALANHADEDDGTCFPGLKRLAEITGLTINTVKAAREFLASAGLISWEDRVRDENNADTTAKYTINIGAEYSNEVWVKPSREMRGAAAKNEPAKPSQTAAATADPSEIGGESAVDGGGSQPLTGGESAVDGGGSQPLTPYETINLKRSSDQPPETVEAPPDGDAGSGQSRPRSKRKTADPDLVAKAFEELWNAWPPAGRKRSAARDKVRERFRTIAAVTDPQAIVSAAQQFCSQNKPEFAPALERWLSKGQYEHYLEGADTASPRKSDPAAQALADLDRRMGLLAKSGRWTLDWGDDPRRVARFYDGPLQGKPYPRELYAKHGIRHPDDQREPTSAMH